MSDIKKELIKIAYENPELRGDLLPLIMRVASNLKLDGNIPPGSFDANFRTIKEISEEEAFDIVQKKFPNLLKVDPDEYDSEWPDPHWIYTKFPDGGYIYIDGLVNVSTPDSMKPILYLSYQNNKFKWLIGAAPSRRTSNKLVSTRNEGVSNLITQVNSMRDQLHDSIPEEVRDREVIRHDMSINDIKKRFTKEELEQNKKQIDELKEKLVAMWPVYLDRIGLKQAIEYVTDPLKNMIFILGANFSTTRDSSRQDWRKATHDMKQKAIDPKFESRLPKYTPEVPPTPAPSVEDATDGYW